MFDILYRGLRTQFLSRSIDLNNFYRGLYTRVILLLLLTGLTALFLNATGHRGVNIILIIPVVLAIGYFGFQPFYLLTIAAVAKMTGLKPAAALETWKKFCVHMALFASVFLLTLGIVPIREHVGGALIIIASLVVLGLLVWAFKKDAKWYQTYVLGLAVLGVVIGAVSLMSPAQRISVLGFDPFRSFTISPQQDLARRILDEENERRDKAAAQELAKKRGQSLTNQERAEIRATAEGRGPMLQQGKAALAGEVFTYTLNSLHQPEQLCGLEAGKSYMYTITEGERIRVRYRSDRSLSESNLNGRTIETNGEALPFAGMNKGWALTLNGTLPDNKASADESGCFTVAFNLTQQVMDAYEIDGGKHVVKIRLHAGALAALRSW